MPLTSSVRRVRDWWRGPADPVLRTVRVLVLVLWPTVCVWVLPGLHRPGDGLVLAWALVVVYSLGAVLLLGARTRSHRLLPTSLLLFAVAATLGALAGPVREMALLVPMFLGVLGAIAAMSFSRRATWVQVAVSSVAGLVCVAWVALDTATFLVTVVAVVAGIAAPAAAVLRMRSQLDEAHAREHRLARTDPLTGTLNRRGLFEAAAVLLQPGREVDVVTLDLDGFKQLNDTFGHAVGDEALRAVAAGLVRLDADGDLDGMLVARLGGEEFLVLAPSGPAPLAELAEAARLAAASSSPTGWATSASVGAVRRRAPDQPEDRQAWLMRQMDAADTLMYRAKRSGGDRVLSEVA